MVNLQNELEIFNKRQERNNEYGAEWASKAVTYLRSILRDEDPLLNKNRPQDVSCPKVPPRLRNHARSKDYYDPRIVSFGPYHHGKAESQAAQMTKTKVMQNFILEHEKSIEDLYIEVRELNDHTRSCYVHGSTSDYNDEELALMMLEDGCFILFFIEWMTSTFQKDKEWMISWKRDIIIMVVNQLGILELEYLYRDLLLLENQIPFSVLYVLMRNIYGENEGLTMIKSFLSMIHWRKFQKEDKQYEDEEKPVHLLGLMKTLISKSGDHVKTMPENQKYMDMNRNFHSFGSVSDLQAKGINFKPSNSISLLSALLKEKPKSISLRDVDFRSGFFFTGELKLPPLILDIDSKVYYTNLMAFELCTCTDFTVTSYINFMNSLIANTEDVKALRSKHIILHTSSDKEVLKMLKEISPTDLPPNWFIYKDVRQKIERNHNKTINMWMGEMSYKYFSHPWSVIGLLAAVAALILTFLQAFYTIYPRKG